MAQDKNTLTNLVSIHFYVKHPLVIWLRFSIFHFKKNQNSFHGYTDYEEKNKKCFQIKILSWY